MTENFQKIAAPADAARFELHDALQLTGCEVSINRLPAGAAVPFVHAHKVNEELYGVLEGAGEIYIDGKVHKIAAGDWFVVRSSGRSPRHPRTGRLGHCLHLHSNEGGQP